METDFGTGICNLTARADRLRMGERDDAPEGFSHDGILAEIITSAVGGLCEPGRVERDTLYIVTAGSGVVASNGEEVDFTTGDVLFAPAGVDRRFTKITQKFRAWKILLRAK